MKFIKKHKIISFIIIIIVLYHALWAANYYSFKKLNGEYEKDDGIYYKAEGKYTISYNYPDYPLLSGNYFIVNSDSSVRLIVWPPSIINQEYKYGVYIYDFDNESEHIFFLDKDMNYISDKNKSEADMKKDIEVFNLKKVELEQMLETLKKNYND